MIAHVLNRRITIAMAKRIQESLVHIVELKGHWFTSTKQVASETIPRELADCTEVQKKALNIAEKYSVFLLLVSDKVLASFEILLHRDPATFSPQLPLLFPSNNFC